MSGEHRTSDPGFCEDCGFSVTACQCDAEADLSICRHGIPFDEACDECDEEFDLYEENPPVRREDIT